MKVQKVNVAFTTLFITRWNTPMKFNIDLLITACNENFTVTAQKLVQNPNLTILSYKRLVKYYILQKCHSNKVWKIFPHI